ncbi:MAG: RIP metalloprotease RseP [Pseudomonadota bacterium]
MSFLFDIPVIGGVLGTVIPFLLLLGIVVFVHEYGHYIVGRWCGIKAEVFSIGFGKRIYGWTDRHGTVWQVAILPLGGFVKFVGDMDPAGAQKSDEGLSEEDRRHAFHNASIRARALTVVAGPVANFLLSIVLFAGIAFALGQASDAPVVGDADPNFAETLPFEAGDRILKVGDEPVSTWPEAIAALQRGNGVETDVQILRDGVQEIVTTSYRHEPIVAQIQPGFPAAQAGITVGDRIVSVNGDDVESFHELRIVTAELPLNTEIEVEVDRAGEAMTFRFTPDVVTRMHPDTDELVEQATMGVSAPAFGGLSASLEPRSFGSAVVYGFDRTLGVIVTTMTFLGDMIFTNADTSQLGGPIGIAQISAAQAEAGLVHFISLVALLSTSIGLLNLFPIPILDGGHLLFYAVEAVRGRPLGERWMNAAMAVGLSLVLLLMGFATYNDLTRF